MARAIESMFWFLVLVAVILSLIALLTPVAQVSPDQIDFKVGGGYPHATQKHGADAFDTLRCWMSGGTMVSWYNPETKRYADVCQPRPDEWGVVITEPQAKALVTAFIRTTAKCLQDVLDYLTRQGYKPLP